MKLEIRIAQIVIMYLSIQLMSESILRLIILKESMLSIFAMIVKDYLNPRILINHTNLALKEHAEINLKYRIFEFYLYFFHQMRWRKSSTLNCIETVLECGLAIIVILHLTERLLWECTLKLSTWLLKDSRAQYATNTVQLKIPSTFIDSDSTKTVNNIDWF